MVLVQKWPFFQLFFFRKYRPGKCVLWYSSTKNAFLGYKNKKFKKSRNWHFSKGVNPWFWSKNGFFFNFLLLGNTGQENVFYDIMKRKNAFFGNKNKKSKKSKNWHFSKGVIPGFASKMAIFPTFLFRQYKPGKCVLWYSRTKKRFSML